MTKVYSIKTGKEIGQHDSSEFTFKIFLGYYQMIPNGLDFVRVWHPNIDLSLTLSEQYDSNKKNFDDFCKVKTIKSALSIGGVTGND